MDHSLTRCATPKPKGTRTDTNARIEAGRRNRGRRRATAARRSTTGRHAALNCGSYSSEHTRRATTTGSKTEPRDGRLDQRDRIGGEDYSNTEIEALYSELKNLCRQEGAPAYLNGFDAGRAGHTKPPTGKMPDDPAEALAADIRDHGYTNGHAEGTSRQMSRAIATNRAGNAVSYRARARFGKHHQARNAEQKNTARKESPVPTVNSTPATENDPRRATRAAMMKHPGPLNSTPETQPPTRQRLMQPPRPDKSITRSQGRQ